MKTEIRKLLGTDKLIIGSDRVVKLLRQGQLKKVMVASNCSAPIRDEVKMFAGTTEVVELDIPNEELGVFCKKPFNIQLLGIRA